MDKLVDKLKTLADGMTSVPTVVSPGGCMWVHMHPVHIPVHPLNYSFNVYQVLAVNSLYALFSCLVFTIHNH